MLFKNRQEAGKKLAAALSQYANKEDVIVLALPRGGVVLGYEIATMLNLPLDLILVRKLGVPWQEELALGAIATNNIRILNKGIVESLNISPTEIEKIAEKEQQELNRRNIIYRQDRPFPPVKDKVIILVDDGIATGATMRAAIKVISSMHAKEIIVAVPVASSSIYTEMADENVKLIVLETPEPFYGIGMWYEEFYQLTDDQVINLLNQKSRSDG